MSMRKPCPWIKDIWSSTPDHMKVLPQLTRFYLSLDIDRATIPFSCVRVVKELANAAQFTALFSDNSDWLRIPGAWYLAHWLSFILFCPDRVLLWTRLLLLPMFPKSWMLSITHHETERHGPLFTSLAFATEITSLQKLRLEERGAWPWTWER